MPAPSDPLIGMVLTDSYQIEWLLGEGGMGKVYAARHVRLPRKAAVKVLQPELASHPDLLKRFQREAEIASSLGSRHIVQVFDFGTLPNGAPYMLMEFLEGRDLDAHLREFTRLHPSEVVQLFDQAVSGLSTAHANNVVHRDIKPANLFLARDGDGTTLLKILDFGLSKIRGAAYTLSGNNAVGTPAYMSPEQLRASAEVDQRTDVYALGITLFELLTGSRPFDDASITRLCERILTDPPPRASSLRTTLTSEVDAVIERALAKDPDERFATAIEFWNEARPALLLCAAQMRTVEVAASPPPVADPVVTGPIAQKPAPPVAESDSDATANMRGPAPKELPSRIVQGELVSSGARLAEPRTSRGWIAGVAVAAALAGAAGWELARTHSTPPPVAAAIPIAAPAPKPAPAPVATPKPAPPPAPVVVATQPAPSPAVKPAQKPHRHSRHAKGASTDGLLGADSLDK